MKVLVLGASGTIPSHPPLTPGFVGSAVASAFTRAGHIVYGQTRSHATGDSMAAQEIFPVVCDPFSDPETWAKIVRNVDVGELPPPQAS